MPKPPETPDPPEPEESRPEPPQPPGGNTGDPLDPANFRHALIRRQAAIYTKKVDDYYILYDPLGERYLRLNEGAHRLWTTVGDHERIAVSEVIGQCECDPEDGLAALIAMAETNFIVIVALARGETDAQPKTRN